MGAQKKALHPNTASDHCNVSGLVHIRKRILPFFITFVVSYATWIVLSGRFDLFHMSLGVIACTIVSFLNSELLFPDVDAKKMLRQWWAFIRYIPWLLYQVFIANLHVMYLVFHPRMMDLIDPQIIQFRSRMKSQMGLFVFANSITLTPGTITVYASVTGDYTVHAIDRHSGISLPGDMERRVRHIMGE